jgi:uncharacterized protein YbjQ (UPF0145 family)
MSVQDPTGTVHTTRWVGHTPIPACSSIDVNELGPLVETTATVTCPTCSVDLPAPTAPQARSVATDMVTTLQIFPGHRIVKVHGVVSELSATSGFTAAAKGNSALNEAMAAIRASAGQTFGANAIVGLTASTFSAGGGITSAFGGDAVGVLITGTAVTLEPDTAHRSDAPLEV